MVEYVQNTLVKGDPLDPSAFDLIVQQGQLAVGQPVPQDWRKKISRNGPGGIGK